MSSYMRRVLSILSTYIPGHPAAFFESTPSSIIAKYIFRIVKKIHGNQHFDYNYYQTAIVCAFAGTWRMQECT